MSTMEKTDKDMVLQIYICGEWVNADMRNDLAKRVYENLRADIRCCSRSANKEYQGGGFVWRMMLAL
jgi:hypothetical protein